MRYPSPFDARFHRRIMKSYAKTRFISFLISFLILALGTLLSGCGRDNSTAVNPVVGTWTFSSATLQETLVLNADNTYSDTETGPDAHTPATITDTYSMPDNRTLIIHGGILGDSTSKVSFDLFYNHMTLDPESGDTETYTRQ